MKQIKHRSYEKKVLLWTITLSIAFVLGALLAYVINFYQAPISKDPTNWANFANYINTFVSVASVLVISALSFLVYAATIQRDEMELKYKEVSERPMIIFKVDKETGRWKIVNLGKGPAFNLTVAFSKDRINWLYPVQCYSLEPGKELVLYWSIAANVWRAVYHDVFKDNTYTSTCIEYETDIKKGNYLPIFETKTTYDKAEWQDEIL